LGEDETLLKFVQSISSIGPVELKRLHLFCGTPVCSRQTPIVQRQSAAPVLRLEPAVFLNGPLCINCKVVFCIRWFRRPPTIPVRSCGQWDFVETCHMGSRVIVLPLDIKVS
jgi:hypothetical protein